MTVVWNDAFSSRLAEATKAGLTRAAAAGALESAKGIAATASPSAPGGFPGTQTGELHRSMTFEAASVDTGGIVSRFGSNLPNAKTMAVGAIIRPKTRKYLTVPVSRAARRAVQQGKTALDILGLVFRRKRGKDPVLGKVKGRGKRAGFEVWFVLKKQVVIAARPWHRLALSRGRDAIVGGFREGFDSVFGGGS